MTKYSTKKKENSPQLLPIFISIAALVVASYVIVDIVTRNHFAESVAHLDPAIETIFAEALSASEERFKKTVPLTEQQSKHERERLQELRAKKLSFIHKKILEAIYRFPEFVGQKNLRERFDHMIAAEPTPDNIYERTELQLTFEEVEFAVNQLRPLRTSIQVEMWYDRRSISTETWGIEISYK